MGRSLAETLDGEAEASAWERDREAWNLPRAPEEAIPREVDTDEHDAGEGDAGEQGAEPPATPPERGA